MAQGGETSLSILSLAAPLLSAGDNNAERLTVPSLEAELEHYKDLFSKLRFSYVEQVTKENFLKAVVANPPDLVDAQENDGLQEQLALAKASLKAKKEHTREKVRELEALGRSLAQSYDLLQLQTTQLDTLPTEIRNLETTIANLKAAQEPVSSDPTLNLPMHATTSLLSQKEAELVRLDRQIAELQSALPDRKRQVAALHAELEPLEARKRTAIQGAREAQKKRGQHVLAQDLDERGKWLKTVDASLRLMLQV